MHLLLLLLLSFKCPTHSRYLVVPAGARLGKTRLPCVCAASVVLTAPGAENRVKGSSSASFPKSLVASPLTVGLAQREANNIVPAQAGSGQAITASTCQDQVRKHMACLFCVQDLYECNTLWSTYAHQGMFTDLSNVEQVKTSS